MAVKNIKASITAFLKENPEPTDHAIHGLAAALGVDKHKFEEMIYAWLALKLRLKKSKDAIPGGLAAGKKDSDFDAKQLAAGIKVEMEHTTSKRIAKEITKDHLTEDKNYYKKLKTIEKGNPMPKSKKIDEAAWERAKKEAGKDASHALIMHVYKKIKGITGKGLSKAMVLRPSDDMEKSMQDDLSKANGKVIGRIGEGARGGEVIGHTSSGKPIYASGHKHMGNIMSHHGMMQHHKKKGEKEAAAKHQKAIDAWHAAHEGHGKPGIREKKKAAKQASDEARYHTAQAAGEPGYEKPYKPLKKSTTDDLYTSLIDHGDNLQKGLYPSSNVTDWANQFHGSPYRVEALKLLKEKAACEEEREKAMSGGKTWREIDNMPRVQREKYREERAKKRERHDAKADAIRVRQTALEKKLIDHQIEQAKRDQQMIKSMDGFYKSLVERGEELSKTMVTEEGKTLHFKELEEKIRRKGGAADPAAVAAKVYRAAGGKPTKKKKKKEKVEKSTRDDLSKAAVGEGARGGVIVGHTAGGKPIYASKKVAHHALRMHHEGEAEHHRAEVRRLHKKRDAATKRAEKKGKRSDAAALYHTQAGQHEEAAKAHQKAYNSHLHDHPEAEKHSVQASKASQKTEGFKKSTTDDLQKAFDHRTEGLPFNLSAKPVVDDMSKSFTHGQTSFGAGELLDEMVDIKQAGANGGMPEEDIKREREKVYHEPETCVVEHAGSNSPYGKSH